MVRQKFTGAGNLPAAESPNFQTPPSPPAVWGLIQVTWSSTWPQLCLPSSPASRQEPHRPQFSQGPLTPPLTSNSCLNYSVKNRTTWIPLSRHLPGNPTPRNSDSFYLSLQLRVQLYKSWHLATKAEVFLSKQNQMHKSSSWERKSIEHIPATIVNGNPHEARSTA